MSKQQYEDIWRNNAEITVKGDKAFWERTAGEIAELTGGDQASIFAALETLMNERAGRSLGWVRMSDIVPGRP